MREILISVLLKYVHQMEEIIKNRAIGDEVVMSKIYIIRGIRVMLDRDLAVCRRFLSDYWVQYRTTLPSKTFSAEMILIMYIPVGKGDRST